MIGEFRQQMLDQVCMVDRLQEIIWIVAGLYYAGGCGIVISCDSRSISTARTGPATNGNHVPQQTYGHHPGGMLVPFDFQNLAPRLPTKNRAPFLAILEESTSVMHKASS